MGDVLAAIREKAQAHQEESKAKRFRDRGGLWQPLSPSKNKLMAFLNSAELRNIQEPSSPVQQTETSIALEISHKNKEKGKERAKSTSHRNKKDKGIFSHVDDTLQPAKLVVHEHEATLAHPKRKRKVKAPGTVTSMSGRKLIDSEPKLAMELPSSNDKELPSPTVKKRIVPAVKSKNKRKLETVDEDDGPIVAISMTDEKPHATTSHTDDHVAPRRRSKRITMKRQRDTSDEEDEVLDYQQSPAKKPRKRADSKAKRPKSTKVGNVTSTAPLSSVQQARMGNEVRETTKGPVLKTGKTQSVVREYHPTETPIIRGRKRLLVPSDVDEPSPVKRRRTNATPQAKEKSKLKTKSCAAAHMALDAPSEESVKTRKRRTVTTKAINKPKSRTKPLEDSPEIDVPSEPGERVGVRGGTRLSPIPEVEEVVEEARVTSKAPMKCASPLLVPGSGIVTRNLGMTKRRRKKAKIQREDMDGTAIDQGVDKTFGISKKYSGRDVVSPSPTLSESEQCRKYGLPPNGHDSSISITQKSTSERLPDYEHLGFLPPQETSKKKPDTQVRKVVLPPRESPKTVSDRNKPPTPRQSHIEPAMDSDFDELDLLS